MGLIDFVLCPVAVILAVIAVIKGNGKFNIFGILSYLCCSLPIVLSLYDIIYRINRNDMAGILDIYPTMAVIFLVILGIFTSLNLYAVLKK